MNKEILKAPQSANTTTMKDFLPQEIAPETVAERELADEKRWKHGDV
jgi:hypothetical protein